MKPYLEEMLSTHFNYTSFRPGQREIIEDVLKGDDVLGVLPTGSGKSICYQLPAKILKGTTIVVSPLISLMVDQVKQLKAMHFKRVAAINSFISYKERMQILQNINSYQLIYISPELIQQEEIFVHMKRMKVSLFVIDEAHCISQWGHEFRPDYLKLANIIQKLNNPPVLALSATVTPQVKKDMMDALRRPNMAQHIYPMDKPNISFFIERVSSNKDKLTYMIDVLKKFHVSTLIYFSSRADAEFVSKQLSSNLPNRKVTFYHGGMDALDRVAVQQQFMNDQLDVICCTSAFGMGINKDNIRMIIHYHLPPLLEAFIQEVGRAGRDGKPCMSILLYAQNDIYLPKSLIDNELPTVEQIRFTFQQLFELYRQQEKYIPNDLNKCLELFHLNENEWRFMHAQLENHGMIKDNQIIYNEESWRQARQAIANYRNSRRTVKQNKLREIHKWIHEEGCLRSYLYKNFQPSFQEPIVPCCSNCGFSIQAFETEKMQETKQMVAKEETWRNKLKKLLLIGDNDEAK